MVLCNVIDLNLVDHSLLLIPCNYDIMLNGLTNTNKYFCDGFEKGNIRTYGIITVYDNMHIRGQHADSNGETEHRRRGSETLSYAR
jgi:hypothetical protein